MTNDCLRESFSSEMLRLTGARLRPRGARRSCTTRLSRNSERRGAAPLELVTAVRLKCSNTFRTSFLFSTIGSSLLLSPLHSSLTPFAPSLSSPAFVPAAAADIATARRVQRRRLLNSLPAPRKVSRYVDVYDVAFFGLNDQTYPGRRFDNYAKDDKRR